MNLDEEFPSSSVIEEVSVSSNSASANLFREKSQQIDENYYFELPDETLIKIDREKQFQWGEAVINPRVLPKQNGYFLPELLNLVDCFKVHSDFFLDHKQTLASLHECLFASINKCDSDFHKMFNGNILVTGGVSNTRGLFDRFQMVETG